MPTTSPASFMDVLSEDQQRVFHKDMGCMTGILQIFDRHPALTAQRYSSRCNPNLHAQIMPTASGKPYHELRSNPAYDMAMDSSQRRTSVDTLEEQLKPAIMEDNTRRGIQSWETTSNKWTSVEKINSLSRNGDSYDRLNVDEEVVKHVQTTITTTTTKPRLSFYIQENVTPPPPPPLPSSSFVATGASLPTPSSLTAQSQNSKLSGPRQLGASLVEMLGGENEQSLNLEALEVKDVLCESLQHRQWSSVPLEKKNSTKDCDAELLLAPVLLSQVSFAFGHLKKSSTLVTGSGSDESELLLCEGRAAPQQQHELMAHSDLPYLCSAETRIDSADVYIDEGCQVQFLLDSMEKDLTMLANDNKLSNLWRSLEPKEVSRLTVELDDGPSISASSRNRHKMTVNTQGSQPPHMPLDNCHCLMKEEVRGDRWTPGFGFTDVLQSSQQGRDGGHPFAVEGCKDVLAREAAVTAASSPGYSGNRSDNVGQKSSSFSVRGGGDHQENNVVARLMGLDKLPNFDQQKKTPPQKSLFCRTPPREVQLPNQPSPPLGVLPLTRVSDESSQMCNIRGSGSCHEAQMQEHRDRHMCEAQMMQEQRDRHPCEAQMVQERRDKHACEAQMMQERRDRHVCEAQIMQERKDRHACEAHHEVRSRSASCQSPKFMEGMPPLLFKQQDAFNNNAMKSGNVPHTGKQFLEENAAAVQKLDFVTRQEPLSGDMAQRVRQLRLRNSVQERKTLKQILEAMQLKGLLHSPNHKQVQGLNSRSDPTMPPTESYLQPHCQESNNQQTPISSKLTISILNNEDYHQAKHEHQETPRLLGSHEYYLANSNTRTHEEMITQGDEVEPQKIELVSLLETDSQTVSVSKKRNDHRSSIVTMKPIKTKVGSLLQAPKVMSPPTSTPGAESENGGGGVKNAQRKPRRGQVRTNNETLKDGQHMNRQQSPLRLLAPSYSSSSSTTTATMKSPAREPPNNSTKSSSQYHRCAFGSGSTRMGEKKSLQGNLSLLKEHEECKLGRLGPSSSKTPKLKESLKKGKTNSLDPNMSRSGKSPSADAKLKTRILDNTARKSQRSSSAFVELASNKIKPSKKSSNNTMAQKFLKKQTPSKLCTNTVMGEEEDTGMDATCQSWVQESANAAATGKVRIIEGEASDHSGDCSLNPENVVLSVSSNMRSSHKSRELEMARAEVVKDKPATIDEEGDFRLQKKPPNFLIKKFELSENLPTVGATMEQPSPVSVLNNTAFEDEELIPSPQSCTTPGINLEVLSDDALERNNKKFTSLVDNVDVEEELAAAAAAAPATVRKKLCFEIDSSQQQQRQQQLLLRPVKTSKDVEDDNDNIELLPFDSKNTTSSALTTSRSITGTSLKNKEDDQQFVHDSLVVVPDQLITKEVFLPEISTQQQHPDVIVPLVHTTPDTSGTTISIDPAMLIRLEQQWQRRKQEHNMSNNQQGCKHEEEHSSKEKKRKKKKKKEILDRRLLLDAFNEITSRKLPLFLNQDVPWTTIFAQQHQHQEQQQQQQLVVSVQEPAMVRSFVKEVWDELRRIPCAQFDDDVHHTVQTVVRKDIGAKLQQSWSEFNVDVTEVGLELERRIFKELVKEVVAEFLWSQRPTTPTTSSTPTTTTTMSTKTSMTTPTTPTTSSTPTTTMSTKTSMTTPTTPTTTAIRVDVEQ